MISFGNNELDALPKAGPKIKCPHCKRMHKLINYSTLGIYKCRGKSYLGSVAGRDVTSTFKVKHG